MTTYLIILVILQSLVIGWMICKIGQLSVERAKSIIKAIKFAEKEEWYEIAQELREKLRKI